MYINITFTDVTFDLTEPERKVDLVGEVSMLLH
jgi:hypothetical protein